jgi:lipoprotein-anchoring transpeptidase ErfK/SrfK
MRRLVVSMITLGMALAATPAFAEPEAQAAAPAVEAPAAPVVAAAPAKPAAPAITMTANIDLSAQRMTVSYGGKVQHTWAISSGTREHASPVGSFKPQWTAKMWYSKKYDMAPMPHAVFFTGGVAVHATQATGRLGSPASHGCIRLAPAHAAQFYGLVAKHGNTHTRIRVHGTPRYRDEMSSRSSRPRTQMAQAPRQMQQPRGMMPFFGQPYYQPQQHQRTYRAASVGQRTYR